ncbi:four helix bundle protein [Pseudidiomarina aquimaris]|uniref:four helix bundle protein n=1 Tax=Pseudidiomarina aquimaris TaxID=641841 RepID=UPI003A97F38C
MPVFELKVKCVVCYLLFDVRLNRLCCCDKGGVMYKDLKVYQSAMDLCVVIYELTRKLPYEERYGLVSQMRRCAVSVPSNIAEGAGRRSFREQVRFYYIARGSLAELETQLELCFRLGYICEQSMINTKQTYQLLNGLIRSTNRRTTNSE